MRVDGGLLAAALKLIKPALAAEGAASPTYSAVEITVSDQGRARLAAFDGATQITTSVPVTDMVAGTVLVSGRALLDIVDAVAGVLSLSAPADTTQLSISAESGATFTLPLVVGELIQLQIPDAETVAVPAETLFAAAKKVTPVRSVDDTRPILNGVLVADEGDGMRLVATDSYRLALCDVAGVGAFTGRPAIVPAAILELVAKSFKDEETIGVRTGDRTISFSGAVTVITSALIAGDYPAYRALLPTDQPYELVADRDALLAVFKQLAAVGKTKSVTVRAVLSAEGCTFRAAEDGRGSVEIPVDATWTGDAVNIAFNSLYMAQAISSVEGDVVHWRVTDGLKPVIVTGDDPSFLTLVMPLRVD